MCLHPYSVDPAPKQTARIAKAAFPKGTTYMTMRDELGAIFEDEDFAHLFPSRGQPAMAPWRLALVTIMQFAEGFSDRQAADAVRGRIDWKYALSLELVDSGFDASVLCEFRSRLLEGSSDGNKENNGCENHEPLQRKGGGQGSKEARDFENNGSFGSTFYPFEQPRYRLCASERGFNEKIFGYQLTRRNPHILGIIRLDKESERG